MAVDKHTFIPIAEAQTPRDGRCMVDRWWIITDNQEIILWRGFSPQCNQNEAIARDLQEQVWPDGDVMHLPVVYLRHRQEWYE